jgi:hypothetical protein
MDEITGISNAQIESGPWTSTAPGVAMLGEQVSAELEIQTRWGKAEGTIYAGIRRDIEITNGMKVTQEGVAKFVPKNGQPLYMAVY